MMEGDIPCEWTKEGSRYTPDKIDFKSKLIIRDRKDTT